MAHQLEIRKDGSASMFYVGSERPWHDLGTQLNAPPSVEEGLRLAGLDWTVSVHPMKGIVTNPDGTSREVLGETRMVIRDSDGRKLSEVGQRWHPLQNKDAFDWFDPFVELGQATLETAGSLFDGEKIWVLAKLQKEPMRIVGDDVVDKYLLLSNAHSDKQSTRILFSSIRVVCFNTLTQAVGSSNTFLKVRHNKNNVKALKEIQKIIDTANATFEATAEQYRTLLRLQVDEKLLKKYIKTVFKPKDEEIDGKEENSENKERSEAAKEADERLIENKIIPLFEVGKGNNLPGVKGTMWAAFNAITEFHTWYAGRTDDARLDNLWFGRSAKLNKRALDVALDFVKNAA